uniref:Putative beta-14-galactosyltransferase n=1 Tax=Ixodes ricinus TaxID=34613 RepID=A0A0K8RHA2_IXORI
MSIATRCLARHSFGLNLPPNMMCVKFLSISSSDGASCKTFRRPTKLGGIKGQSSRDLLEDTAAALVLLMSVTTPSTLGTAPSPVTMAGIEDVRVQAQKRLKYTGNTGVKTPDILLMVGQEIEAVLQKQKGNQYDRQHLVEVTAALFEHLCTTHEVAGFSFQ